MRTRIGYGRLSGLAKAIGLASFVCGCSAGPLNVLGVEKNSLSLGLIAHWSCDEGAGSTLVDRSGNGHDGVIAGATWIAGEFSGALHFDGAGSVIVPNFPQAASNWTVATWYRPPVNDQPTDFLTLLSTEIPYAGGWELSVILTPSKLRYDFGFATGGDSGATPYQTADSNLVEAEVWAQLTGVVDADLMRVSLYENGELVDAQPLTSLMQPGRPSLYIGRWGLDERRHLIGDLDDIAIYNRVLSQSEIRNLVSKPVPDPR